MSTKKNFSVFFLLRIIKTAMQIVILSLSARFFGVSFERDAWIIASTFILAIDIIVWGPINETFRTKFIHIKESDTDFIALQKTRSLFLFTNVITIIIAVLVFLFSSEISNVLGPKYSEDMTNQLSSLIRIMAPTLFFNQINMLITSVLNAYNVIFVPEIAGFFSAVINVLVIYFLTSTFGIYSLAFAYYVNLFFLLGLLIFYVNKQKIELFRFNRDYSLLYIKDFFIFALPYYVPYVFSQIYTLSEKYIASFINVT